MAAFFKGRSGNPTGKKKGSGKSAQRYLHKRYGRDGKMVFDALHELAFDHTIPPRERLAALKELRATGWSEQANETVAAPKMFALTALPALDPIVIEDVVEPAKS